MSGFQELVRMRCIQIESVDLLDLSDPTHRFSPERWLSLECVKHDALQQIAEREVVVLGECLQHFDETLLHSDASLGAFDRYHGTMVQTNIVRRQSGGETVTFGPKGAVRFRVLC